jgi:NADPH-dependent 2,4-dienoyl-CoA reductase/sulfur reductase-like enzyme
VATPELFKDRFNINVFLNSNVLSIDRERKEITYENLTSVDGATKQMSYDELVIATGAKPMPLRIKGFQGQGVFSVRTIPDVDEIKKYIVDTRAQSAVVVGGGFIGLEMAENLHRLGIKVTIIELASHLLPPLDEEMTFPLEQYIKQDFKIDVITGDAVIDCIDSKKALMQCN